MKNDEDIKKLTDESTVRINECVDREILNDALSCLSSARHDTTENVQSIKRRRIMRHPMTRIASAAAIALAVILAWIVFGTPSGGAGAVYAAAADRVRQARTFSCVEAFDMTYEHEGRRGTFTLKQKIMFKEPDRQRREQLTTAPVWPQELGRVTIWDYGKRQQLDCRPLDKTAEFYDMNSDYFIDKETGALKLTELNTRIRDSLLEASATAVEDLGRVELDGQSVRRLRSSKGDRVTTVWVDPETHHPVRVEYTWPNQDRAPVLFTSIQIDGDLDDALFSLEPPAGYTLSTDRSDWPGDKKKVMTKARYLGLQCVIYAGSHEDRFPDKLTDLVTAGMITDKVLRRVLAAPDDPNGAPAIRYRKPRADSRDRSAEVVLYEIYNQWPHEGVVTCFADGHCERIMDRERIETLIAPSEDRSDEDVSQTR